MTRPTHRDESAKLADGSRMLTALVRLRGALQGVALPLEMPGVDEPRAAKREMIDQLEDYIIPRLMTIEAPLLAVVGGSTGAGKSTLVNALVGHRVTTPGVLRPTTRSPVLVHHPDDASWFGQDRLLPDLVRVNHSTNDPDALQLVATTSMPQGLAVLDAPDVDSVEERNRQLAAQLLAAADLWLFVTSAARYADQVPWGFLKQAAERSTAVAIVLDRTPAEAVQTVATHLARMLASRGLKDSPLFTVTEGTVDADGLLPPEHVAPIRAWLDSLAADSDARTAVVKQTLEGAIRSLTRRTHGVADAAAEQVTVAARLRVDADRAYDDAVTAVGEASADGTLLRGEVLARWQEFVGTGELLRSLEDQVGWIRDRLVNAVKGKPQQAERVTVAVESGLETLILEHAEAAAERAEASWQQLAAGQGLLAAAPEDLGRASRDLRRKAERSVRDWQQEVLEMVRTEGADKRVDRAVPGVRRQRTVGRADGRGLRPHRRRHRRRGRRGRRVGRAGPEAARGGLRRPGRALAGRARRAAPSRRGSRACSRTSGPATYAWSTDWRCDDARRGGPRGLAPGRRPAVRCAWRHGGPQRGHDDRDPDGGGGLPAVDAPGTEPEEMRDQLARGRSTVDDAER